MRHDHSLCFNQKYVKRRETLTLSAVGKRRGEFNAPLSPKGKTAITIPKSNDVQKTPPPKARDAVERARLLVVGLINLINIK